MLQGAGVAGSVAVSKVLTVALLLLLQLPQLRGLRNGIVQVWSLTNLGTMADSSEDNPLLVSANDKSDPLRPPVAAPAAHAGAGPMEDEEQEQDGVRSFVKPLLHLLVPPLLCSKKSSSCHSF